MNYRFLPSGLTSDRICWCLIKCRIVSQFSKVLNEEAAGRSQPNPLFLWGCGVIVSHSDQTLCMAGCPCVSPLGQDCWLCTAPEVNVYKKARRAIVVDTLCFYFPHFKNFSGGIYYNFKGRNSVIFLFHW